LLPRSVLDDGLLDVCVTAEVSRERLGELAALVPAGTHLGEREVTYARGTAVRIERVDGEALEIEHDGDPLQMGPQRPHARYRSSASVPAQRIEL
jgi:diacylglycerol kinase (ATP)